MERKSIPFNAKIGFVEKINDEFLKCKVYVCALGKNRNLSYISREAAEEALYSLYNIPVVGHLYEDENGALHMGGHDSKIEKDANGNYIWKSVCVPYGTIPYQDTVHYEDIQEPNGDIKTYLVANCILWAGRFPELAEAAYSDEWLFNQSMEINVEDYTQLEEDKNYTDILHYTYSALCLLGKSDDVNYTVEPCFPESHLEVAYNLNDKFVALLDEFRKDLSKIFSVNDIRKEESQMTLETKNNILNEYGIKIDALNFEIPEDMTEEAFREKLDEFVKTRANENAKCSFTYREKADALSKAMPNSDSVFYWVCDFDEKYAYVERGTYDQQTDTYIEEKGRLEYTYAEKEKTAAIVGEFESMVVRWLTKDEDAAITTMRGQYEELIAYKKQREENDKQNAIDETIKQFTDLSGNEEFEKIVTNKYSYDNVEAIQNACYIIRGKYGIIPKSNKSVETTVPVGTPRTEITLREKFHEVYGKR